MRKHFLAFVVAAGCGGGGGGGGESSPPAPDFAVTLGSTEVRLGLSDSTTVPVTVRFANGFSSPSLALSIAGLPEGVTASFSPNPLPHQGISLMALVSGAGAQTGTFPVTVSVVAGGLARTATATLVVTSSPFFRMAIAPQRQSVMPGNSVTYSATLSAVNGFSSLVALSVEGLPAGSTGSFSPDPAAMGTAVLTVGTSGSTPLGIRPLTLQGTGGGWTERRPASVTVSASGAWAISIVGSVGDAVNCIVVGAARGDGVSRVYAGTVQTGKVFEYTRSGAAWVGPSEVMSTLSPTEVHNMGIGPGRNDGVARLYVGGVDGRLYEARRTGSAWSRMVVAYTPGEPVFHAAIGRGRNDGVDRVYSAHGPRLLEHTWNGADWTTVPVGSIPSPGEEVLHGLAIGPSPSDGLNRVYGAATAGRVLEFGYSGGAWTATNLGPGGGDMRNVGVGQPRNDGVNRVYGSRADGTIREYTYASGWSSEAIAPPVGEWLIHAKIAAGRNDGILHLYSSGSNGNLFEFTRTGTAWTTATLGGGTGYMYGFDVGPGRNDGIVRLYGGSEDFNVYEYTWQ